MTQDQYRAALAKIAVALADLAKQVAKLPSKPNQQVLYDVAKSCLGRDMALTQNELGCAEAVNAVHKQAFGSEIGGGLSTAAMYAELLTDARFMATDTPLPGDVIISPTGKGNPGTHGHVGIVAKYGILSNNSLNGLWQEKYTLDSWYKFYTVKLGFPIYYFRRLGTTPL